MLNVVVRRKKVGVKDLGRKNGVKGYWGLRDDVKVVGVKEKGKIYGPCLKSNPGLNPNGPRRCKPYGPYCPYRPRNELLDFVV